MPFGCRLSIKTKLILLGVVSALLAVALSEKLECMQRAAKAGDFGALAQLAHWLKGAGGTAGFGALTKPAGRLEQYAKHQQADQLDAALAELCRLRDRIVIAPLETAPAGT